jgi:integrase
MSVFQLPSGRWRVQVRRVGYPNFDKVFRTERQARAANAELLKQAAEVVEGKSATLENLWARYAASFEFKSKAPHTQRTELGRAKPLLAELGRYSLDVLEQSPQVIYDYIDRRSAVISPKTKRKLSNTSIRLEVATLSAIVAWAKRRKVVTGNFIRHIDRPGQAKRKRRVRPVEQARLEMAVLKFDDPKLAEAARFALLLRRLGCRPGELASVLQSDISLRNAELVFRNTKYLKQDRRIPLSEEAVSLIDAQLAHALDDCDGSPYLFSTMGKKGDRAEKWQPYGYSGAVKRLRDAEVVPADFHAHAMRREFISRAIEAGIPYATIRKMTGHHSTQAIEIYDEGLAVAPDVRKALDDHQTRVSDELLLGHFEAMGLTPEQIEDLLLRLKGEQPKAVRRVYANGERSR